MKTKQVLDVQQMRHLQELGLDTSNASALYCIDNETNEKQIMWNEQVEETDKDYEYFRIVPAYTLQDVLDALPKEIIKDKKRCWLSVDLADNTIEYYNEYAMYMRRSVYFEFYKSSSLIDAAYKMLCWVLTNKYIQEYE